MVKRDQTKPEGADVSNRGEPPDDEVVWCGRSEPTMMMTMIIAHSLNIIIVKKSVLATVGFRILFLP